MAKLCKAAASPAAEYLSLREKNMDDVEEFHWLETYSEKIVLATLAFLNLAMMSVVY